MWIGRGVAPMSWLDEIVLANVKPGRRTYRLTRRLFRLPSRTARNLRRSVVIAVEKHTAVQQDTGGAGAADRDGRHPQGNCQLAMSAPATLEQVKAIPDPSLILILSDINMPGMTGLEMLPKVKAERPNVPVIMITAYGDDVTRKKASELGAAGLLLKPIDFSLLRQEIEQRLERAA